ncbi:bifunctional proline dehydrogenase/L-glutamate gamma-semialdehyde dehydrogenase [Pseudolysinimonas kribbensis]|uniref:bifunctional proline dehydrogenase/L-glutamate gamma-semialdehyde dehydrogenase n=1 Tax=Pseudolysinimonas kribbensis TaxID=433641 RepID=UPI003CD0B03E
MPSVDETVALVRRWLAQSADAPRDAGATRLAGVLKDPHGLEFTLGFIDRVVRPEDLRVAGRSLEQVSRLTPRFLPWHLRTLVRLGGAFAPLLPWPIVPIARRVLRRMVAHLVIDASPKRLTRSLAHLRRDGVRLNINLLGEAVLGEREAARRLAGTRELLSRPDVDYVSVKVSSVASQLNLWGFDETVERVVERLLPIYLRAARASGTKFINLDMEEYRDLHLTIAVFVKLLENPDLQNLEAGIVLQAYLPDSVVALDRLTEWARRRVAAGGAGIKVRIVKGANLSMERVDAAVHDWPLATWGSKAATDANYLRLLERAFAPERTDAVRIGVAGHNLFDLAFAWLLAEQRGVSRRVDVEMLLGMTPGQASAVRQTVGGLLLYTPVVHPDDFEAAISYLARRLEENGSSENFLSSAFELEDDAVFARERERFEASLALLDDAVPAPNRIQNRLHPPVPRAPEPFENTADTDPSIAVNREWARGLLDRAKNSAIGEATLHEARVADPATLQQRLAAASAAGATWGARTGAERGELLDRIGEVLAALRGRLIEVMVAETGKTLAEADVEVSEAVDFAHYYAGLARELAGIEGAAFAPVPVVLVAPPWNFPVSIPAGGVLQALAAGSAVILKPAPQAGRCGAILAEAFREAGAPRELVTLVDIDEGELGRALITAPEVGRVVLTGSTETAALFRGWKPELRLLAETSGKNSIIVTPSADLDLAVSDIVKSAFGNAGQKCSAASLAILVGSVATSERFRRQLADAVTSLAVGQPTDPAVQMGPLVEPPGDKLTAGLTRLGPGESWLVEPRRLDDDGRLWSPGVRDGVVAGSAFHRIEYFGPVLGLMSAATLEEAVALQNAVEYGLTAGIHSLDAGEVAQWLDTVQAGNLYVNRPITGAIVRRQPFGGWKASSVGPGYKAGGPNALLAHGSWRPVPAAASGDLRLDGLEARVASVIEASQPALGYEEFDLVRRGALSDAAAWAAEFATARDVSGLEVERNVFRYRPADVVVRLAEGASMAELVRVVAAGVLARASIRISSSVPLPAGLLPLVQATDLGGAPLLSITGIDVEPDAAFASRVVANHPDRIRLVSADPEAGDALARATGGSPDVAIWADPVTAAGRIELLPFLLEQAVSITAHRFGAIDPPLATLEL